MVVRRFKIQNNNRPFLLSGIGYGPKGKEALRRDAEVVRGKGYYVRIVQMGKDSALNGIPRWGAFVLPKQPKSGFRGLGMMNPFSWINASKANVVMPQRKIRNPEALETMFYYGQNKDKDPIVIDKSWLDFDGRIVEITAEELEEDRKENPLEIWGDFILDENDAQYHIKGTEEIFSSTASIIPPIRIYSKNMNVDCTGMNCPYPVLMAKNALKEMQPGETLTLTATDWEAEYDVPLLAERYGHELESVEKNRATGEIIFTIKKGGSRSYNQEKEKPRFQKLRLNKRTRDRRYNSRYRDWDMKIDEAISKLELSGGRFSTISELQRMKDTIRSAEEMGIELDADQIDDVIIEGLSPEAKKAVDWRSMILGDELDIETLFESPQRVDATDFTAMPPFTTDEMPSDFMSLPIDLQQEVNRIEDALMVQDTLDSFTDLDTGEDKFDFESEFDKILEGL